MSQNFYKTLWQELRAKKIWQGEVKNIDKFGNTYYDVKYINDKGKEITIHSLRIGDRFFDSEIIRLSGKNTPIPYNPKLEAYVVPSKEDITDAIYKAVNRK